MEQCVVTNSRLTRGSIAKISEGDEGKITARFSERQRERERERRDEEGRTVRWWLAIARPPTGAASYGLATRKGAAGCGQGQPAREAGGARKGRQTPVAYRRPPVGAAACRGGIRGAARRGGGDDNADGANGLGHSF
ncbi:hypothetical protein BHM03_00048741 [Ensete ventricosum]|nr:hypothetical protein BHM03_00048741 [Ensete ventricosum]